MWGLDPIYIRRDEDIGKGQGYRVVPPYTIYKKTTSLIDKRWLFVQEISILFSRSQSFLNFSVAPYTHLDTHKKIPNEIQPAATRFVLCKFKATSNLPPTPPCPFQPIHRGGGGSMGEIFSFFHCFPVFTCRFTFFSGHCDLAARNRP